MEEPSHTKTITDKGETINQNGSCVAFIAVWSWLCVFKLDCRLPVTVSEWLCLMLAFLGLLALNRRTSQPSHECQASSWMTRAVFQVLRGMLRADSLADQRCLSLIRYPLTPREGVLEKRSYEGNEAAKGEEL